MPAQNAFLTLKNCAPTISVGIMSADLMNLGAELSLLDQVEVIALHFDVMDGCFVPFMTAGPPFIKGVKTHHLKDVHLMIQDPLDKIEDYVQAGADMITVHVESGNNVGAVLEKIGTMENQNIPERGLIRGIALIPGTSLTDVEPLLNNVEMISVLGVDPRTRKMTFDDSTGNRVAEVNEMISTSGKEILLCIDGGIKRNNITEIAKMGADILVSGSAIFDGKAPLDNARFMLNAVKSQAKSEIQ